MGYVRRIRLAVLVPLVAFLATGCETTEPPCDASGCDLEVGPGERHPVSDGAELSIPELALDTATVQLGDEVEEITVGTTGEVSGYRVTVVSIDGQRVRVLVAPAARTSVG